jgi:hypothetical protein
VKNRNIFRPDVLKAILRAFALLDIYDQGWLVERLEDEHYKNRNKKARRSFIAKTRKSK